MHVWPSELLPERGVAGGDLPLVRVWLLRGDFVMDHPPSIMPKHGAHWGHQLCQLEAISSGVYCCLKQCVLSLLGVQPQ